MREKGPPAVRRASLWGRPRLTADIDVRTEIPYDRVDAFIEAMMTKRSARGF